MTTFPLHNNRPHVSARRARFLPAGFIKQAGSALKKIHRAIAAAKIHRFRNELMLRGHIYQEWNEERCDRGGHALHGPQRSLSRGQLGFPPMRIIMSMAKKIGSVLRAVAISMLRLLAGLGNEPIRAYRPEAHYMRGPGPAWRAKHPRR